MRPGPRLTRSFFERPCLQVAPELVGALLVRTLPDGTRLSGRLVEVEAYLGDGSDPAAHTHGGQTPRNRTMFGPAGRLYAYRSYGIHVCVNLVTEPAGRGAAVLLRALEPCEGADLMRRNRGLPPEASELQIARGPGRLAEALGLTLAHDGVSVLGGELRVCAAPTDAPRLRVAAGPRVGIRKAAAHPYRFYAEACRWVSPFRPGKLRARPSRR